MLYVYTSPRSGERPLLPRVVPPGPEVPAIGVDSRSVPEPQEGLRSRRHLLQRPGIAVGVAEGDERAPWSVRISQHPVPPDSGDIASSAGYHTRTGETVGAGLPPRCRMLAAGLTVSLCLAWTGAARITHAPAIPGGPVVRAMALTGFAGDGEECLHVPGRTPRRARGLELLRRGVDSLRQRVARAAHAPVAGPVISTGSAAVGSGQLAGGMA